MRRVLCLLVSMVLGAAVAGPARADFIKDFRDWQKLGTEGQAAYAMAVFDVMTVVVDNNPFAVARSVGLRSCGISLKLNAANVAQAITKFYVDYPEARRASPFIAFNGYVERGACSPFVNQARKQMGLPPMAPSPIPKPSP